MVLDTSAVLALLLNARGAGDGPVLAKHGSPLIGAPTFMETTAVMLARKGRGGVVALDSLLARLDVRVVPTSTAAAKLARLAHARFGEGVGDPGVLNFGDCLAYGMAMSEREPLLFKGDAFSGTDVLAVACVG